MMVVVRNGEELYGTGGDVGMVVVVMEWEVVLHR